MEIFIETCLKDFFIALINQGKVIDYIWEKDLIKKSNYLPIAFREILSKNNLSIKDVSSIYTTTGPGSFMGIRAASLFTASLAHANKISLYATSTLHFISGGQKGVYSIDAKSQESFSLNYVPDKKCEIKIVPKTESTIFDYNSFIENYEKYLSLFKLEKDPLKVKCLYLKELSVN